ncbi:MAG: helix-turn-helix transcriptional regulator [Clostridia bacterium]|nr:helix-turn-helix transcriptional regulator [Clostridia bacterium]MBR6603947.1 helix-turn-helix transcriptional regulator [Clostridia bacterium]
MPRENKLFLYQTQERRYSDNATYFNIEDRTYIYDPLMVNAYHWHDYFEMEFFCEGEGTHILNGETLTVRRGSIHLLTPADFHTLYKKEECGEMKYFNVNFNEYALSSELIKMISEYGAPLSTVVTGEDYDQLYSEFKALTAEYKSSRPMRDMMIKNMFEKIIIIFWRALTKNMSESKRQTPKHDSNVRYIVSYLRIHFREQVSLAALAKEVHLTPNYVGDLFRRETGVSFTDYVQRLRLNYATNLLVSSDLPIADISVQSGFHSVSYFIRTFRLANGKTPLEYRNTTSKKKL